MAPRSVLGVHRDVTDSPARHRALQQSSMGHPGQRHVDSGVLSGLPDFRHGRHSGSATRHENVTEPSDHLFRREAGRSGRREIAREHFRTALLLARNPMEQRFLERRMTLCGGECKTARSSLSKLNSMQANWLRVAPPLNAKRETQSFLVVFPIFNSVAALDMLLFSFLKQVGPGGHTNSHFHPRF